jgi:hypothetical protein
MTILRIGIRITHLDLLVLNSKAKTCSQMGLFSSSVVAAAFKLPPVNDEDNNMDQSVTTANHYDFPTPKTHLAKNAAGLDFHVLRLTMLLLKDSKYKDCLDNDSERAIKECLDNFAEIEEPIFLVGNKEWLKHWDLIHKRLNLGDQADNIEEDTINNYFQRNTEKIG